MTTLEERPAPATPPLPTATRAADTRGWYADPAGCHEFRYWDGLRWTPGVADRGFVREDPLPEQPCAPSSDARIRPPLRSAAIGLAGLVLGAVASVLISLAFNRWARLHDALAIALAQLGLWTGMVGAVVLVSRRYGSGNVRDDYGLRIRAVDAGWGLLLGLVSRALALVIVVVVLAAAGQLDDASLLGAPAVETHRLVVLCLMLVVGAPLVEELFFRGLLLRSFQTRMRAPLAVGVQAVLFSAGHALTTSGLGLVSELLSTLMFGLLAGAVVVRFRRLGPTIVAHALFNSVVAIALIVAST